MRADLGDGCFIPARYTQCVCVLYTYCSFGILAFVLNFMAVIHCKKPKSKHKLPTMATTREQRKGKSEINTNLMRKTKTKNNIWWAAAYLVSDRQTERSLSLSLSHNSYMATAQLKFQLMVNIYTFQIVYHILSFGRSRTHTYTHLLHVRRISFSSLNGISISISTSKNIRQFIDAAAFYCGLLYANNIFNTSISQCAPLIIAAVAQALWNPLNCWKCRCLRISFGA